MNCQRCGTHINPGESFCRSCGAQVVPTSNQINNTIPTNNPENASYGQTSNQVINNSYQPNDDELLKAYIGNNAEKIMKGGFSFCTFFFGIFYLFYRKMYLLGVAWLVGSYIFNMFLPSYATYIMWGANIVIAMIFNSLYLKKARQEIEKIKSSNPSSSPEQLVMQCRQKGGTSLVILIITLVLFGIFFFLVMMALFEGSYKTGAGTYNNLFQSYVLKQSSNFEWV